MEYTPNKFFYLSVFLLFSLLLTACSGGSSPASDAGQQISPPIEPLPTPSPVADTTPDSFSFSTQTNVATNTEINSSTITVSGIDSTAAISVTNGSYSVENGAFTTSMGNVTNGQSVVVRVMSSNANSTAVTASLTIGDVSADFTAITEEADTMPDLFNFIPQTNVALDTLIDSNAVTITGINNASAISITGGSYQIGSGEFTTAAGSVNNGDTVVVRLTSSRSQSTAVTAALTIGGITAYFSVTTVEATANPLSIMSIGHSLLGHPHMPAAINAIAADAGINIQFNKTQNNPGASLNYNFNYSFNSHVDDYLVELVSHDFDVFIITEAMAVQSHVAYSNSHHYANAFYDAAIADNPATQFYIWQTWDCRADLSTGNCDAARAANGLVGQIKLDLNTWEGIADAVSAAHDDVDIPIIPGGLAMIALDEAITANEVDGITDIAQIFSDDIHLNANGWYFMALVQYSAIYKTNPIGLTHTVPDYPNTLSAAAAATMQQLAWDTVCSYERSGVSCGPSPDDDGDDLTNAEEVSAGTDPNNADTDGDLMPDGYEVSYGFLPTVHDNITDTDADGYSNIDEFLAGTNPTSNLDYPGILPAVAGCAADRAANTDNSSNPYSYNGSMAMGHNLGAFAYWESAYPFIDLRRQSDTLERDIGPWNISDGTAIINSHRNIVSLPTGMATKGLVSDALCLYGGDYVVLWDSTKAPEVSLIYHGLGSLTLQTDDASNGRRVYSLDLPADMTPEEYKSSILLVSITAPITGNVDYHVLLPGTEGLHQAGGLFNPDFIEDIGGSQVLRFMDWFATNNSDKTDIADLPSMDWDSWADDQGVPYGVAMKLVKEAHVPIAWMTVPHQMSAIAMDEIARQVYAEWVPGITVYIEFSNEIWNFGFDQTHYAAAQGAIMFPGLSGLNAQSTWLAEKSIEMKRAFQSAFGADAAAINLVVAGHIQTNSYVDPTDLDFCYENCRLANQYNDIENEIDVFAVAPYLSGSLQGANYAVANDVVNWTDTDFYNHLNADLDTNVTTDIESITIQMADNKAKIVTLTGRTDIEFAVYEFGQHISSFHAPNSLLDERYKAFQSTAEMGALYHDLIQVMITAGVTTAAHFNLHYEHAVGYYWGSKQGISAATSPRHQAVEAAY